MISKYLLLTLMLLFFAVLVLAPKTRSKHHSKSSKSHKSNEITKKKKKTSSDTTKCQKQKAFALKMAQEYISQDKKFKEWAREYPVVSTTPVPELLDALQSSSLKYNADDYYSVEKS